MKPRQRLGYWYHLVRRHAFLLTLLTAVSGVLFVVSPSPASALTTVPTKMNFQGRLTDSSGNVKANGTYNMKLRLYTVASGGSTVWTEDRLVSASQGVTVTNGLFSIQLGSVTSLPANLFASGELYLEVELPTPATATSASPTWTEGPMTPRNQMATSAYAYNAETLDGLDSADFIQNTTSPQTANFNITGNGVIGGTLTVGAAATQGSIVVHDGSGQTATIQVGNLAGNYTYTIPVTTANDTFCMLTLANCASGGGVSTVGALDGGTANATGATISGSTLYLQSASATNAGLVNTTTQTFAGNKTFSGDLAVQDVSLAAGKTITIAGGATGTRPASPAEGMIYYDTTTKQLLTYTNGKWQADRTEAVIVAASNSSQADKDAADYVADGNTGAASDGDQVQINSALTAGSGKKVVLLAGTYIADATILTPNNTTLTGVGNGTVIELADIDATDNLIENSDTVTGAGIVIEHLALNGRKDLNTAGAQRGIFLQNVGNVSAVRAGAKISHVRIHNFRSGAIMVAGTEASTLENNTMHANDGNSLDVVSSYSSVSNNIITDSGAIGLSVGGADVTVSGNTVKSATATAISVATTSSTIVGNIISSSASIGMGISGSNNLVSSNKISETGGATTTNGIVITDGDDNSIVGNSITDSSCSTNCYAIVLEPDADSSDDNYLADNTLGGGSINDAGTGTIYANQLNSSGQFVNRASGGFAIQGTAGTNLFSTAGTTSVTIGTSDTTGTLFVLDTKTDAGDPTGIAGGMYYNSNAGKFRCYQGGAWADCIGASLTANNTFTGTQTINVASTGAFDVQNGSAVSVFKVDSSTSTVTLGTATNGSVFTASGVIYVGTARPSRTITLVPEYAGATFTADGSNNNGSLSSDFCSSSTLLNVNAAVCPITSDEHNYYAWTTTQGTAQDYDLYVRYQIPSDYDTGSMTNMKFTAMGTLGANEIASLAMYNGDATACSTITDAITSNATWAISAEASPLGACTIVAGEMVTFKIKLTAVSNGVARAGTISFDYRSKF